MKKVSILLASFALFATLFVSACDTSSDTDTVQTQPTATPTATTQTFQKDGFQVDYSQQWTESAPATDIYSFAGPNGITQFTIHMKALYFDVDSMLQDLTPGQKLTCTKDSQPEESIVIDKKTFLSDTSDCTNDKKEKIKVATLVYTPASADNSQPTTEKNQIVILLESSASTYDQDHGTYFQPMIDSLTFS
ncbi:hypothetical protein [Ktedonospora formicarum]|nr:hypothetical protein [Ktedonospora formicarum]